MALVIEYNSIKLALGKSHHELLDIYGFIETFQYPIDKFIIDRFWNGINNDEWIVIDYEMLRWMGYRQSRDTDNKKQYLHLLESRFTRSKDYDTTSPAELSQRGAGPPSKKGGKVASVVVVKARTFKKSLMILHSSRAEVIRDYYITLEELMLDYLRYTQAIKDHNATLALKAIEEEKAKDAQRIQLLEQQLAEARIEFDVDTTPIPRNEYVYILTNKRHYNQSLFKIGKSINPKSRLISYNTSSPIADEDMFYIAKIATCDCSGLEKLIHRLLANFKLRREWFHIPHRDLISMIKMITQDMTHWIDSVDSIVVRGFNNIEPIPLNEFNSMLEKTYNENSDSSIEPEKPKLANESYCIVEKTDITNTEIANKRKEHVPQSEERVSTPESHQTNSVNDAQDQLKKRIRYRSGASTKLSELKAIDSSITSAKLSNYDNRFEIAKKNICLSCKALHKRGCCSKYNRSKRSTAMFIQNLILKPE